MINKRGLCNDLTAWLSVIELIKDIPAEAAYRSEDEIINESRHRYRNFPQFHSIVGSRVAKIFELIDKNTEDLDGESIEADAARYRHIRDSWKKRRGSHRLEWELPHVCGGGNTLAEQLDNNIDSEIQHKARRA